MAHAGVGLRVQDVGHGVLDLDRTLSKGSGLRTLHQ